MNRKNALIIGTEFATNGLESGGSLRVSGIRKILERLGFNVHVVSRDSAKKSLRNKWDLIVLVSFATAKLLRRARKSSSFIWFDSTDSWRLTRFSLIRSGDLKQIPLLIRDLFWLWIAPKIDLLTFITRRDAEYEKTWWIERIPPFIIPVNDLLRPVNHSPEIRLVFVGDGKYQPNMHSIDFLTRVLDLLPMNFEIHVYGRGFECSDSRFIVHGYCPNEKMYFENDIHLAPIESGAGLKLKVAVPLMNGLKVISTPEGAIGFSGNQNLHIAVNEESFAKHIFHLIKAPGPSNRISQTDIYVDDETALLLDWICENI